MQTIFSLPTALALEAIKDHIKQATWKMLNIIILQLLWKWKQIMEYGVSGPETNDFCITQVSVGVVFQIRPSWVSYLKVFQTNEAHSCVGVADTNYQGREFLLYSNFIPSVTS